MNTSKNWDINTKQADGAMHWNHICGLAVQTGVWLRAKETDISATIWASELGINFTFR